MLPNLKKGTTPQKFNKEVWRIEVEEVSEEVIEETLKQKYERLNGKRNADKGRG